MPPHQSSAETACDEYGYPKLSSVDLEDRDRWLELAKISQADFFARRTIEWRLSIGFWLGIAAFIYAASSTKPLGEILKTYITESPCSAIGVCILLWLLHALPLWLLQESHAKERELYWWYRELAEGRPAYTRPLKYQLDENDKSKLRRNFNRRAWFFYHMATTALLLVAALITISGIQFEAGP